MTCAVEGCDRRQVAKSLCDTHYRRWRKIGTPSADQPIRAIGATLCTIESCDRDHYARGWCSMHWKRWLKTGDPLTVRATPVLTGSAHPQWAADKASYAAAHDRVRNARGKASAHACADCGSAAAEWSYDHADPNEKSGVVNGHAVPYSINPAHYEPRCKPCHRQFDAKHSDPKSLSLIP